MKKEVILVVEDEPDIQELVRYYLDKEGYRVIIQSSGENCLEITKREKPNLVILDLMLPGIDGLEICRLLKGDSDTASTPIIFLSAKGEEVDIVTGLELGAEDYITKPFNPRVLIARVRTALRRGKNASLDSKDRSVQIGDICINPERFEVHVSGEELDLNRTGFKILYLLTCNAGRVFTREQIVDRVHGDDYPVTLRSIDVQMVSLRKKLKSLGSRIETIRGIGYRFKDDR